MDRSVFVLGPRLQHGRETEAVVFPEIGFLCVAESCVSFGVWDFYIAIISLGVWVAFFMIHVASAAGTLLMHDEDCDLKHCPLNISEWETCLQLTTQLCMFINVIL